jgi:hypothetical protein
MNNFHTDVVDRTAGELTLKIAAAVVHIAILT